MNSIQRELPADATQAQVLRPSSTNSMRTRPATATSCSCRCPSTGHGRHPGADRPRQGRRRPAPDQPWPAGAQRQRRDHLAAAVHAPRRHRAPGAQRLQPRGQARRGGRPRRHDRPLDRPAAHPRAVNATVTLTHTGTENLSRVAAAGGRHCGRGGCQAHRQGCGREAGRGRARRRCHPCKPTRRQARAGSTATSIPPLPRSPAGFRRTRAASVR